MRNGGPPVRPKPISRARSRRVGVASPSAAAPHQDLGAVLVAAGRERARHGEPTALRARIHRDALTRSFAYTFSVAMVPSKTRWR